MGGGKPTRSTQRRPSIPMMTTDAEAAATTTMTKHRPANLHGLLEIWLRHRLRLYLRRQFKTAHTRPLVE